MRLTHENVYGQTYYAVKCNKNKPWPWKSVVAWCEKTYGPPVFGTNSRWYKNDIVTNGKIWFRDEQDLFWFSLKWS